MLTSPPKIALPRGPRRPPRHRAAPALRLTTVGGTVGVRIGSALIAFAAGVVATRHLGSTGRSHLAVVLAVPGMFGVMGLFGFDTANLRFASRSHTAFRQLVNRSILFSAVGGTILPAAWWLAAKWWPLIRLGLDPRLALVSAALCPLTGAVVLLGTAEIGRGRPVPFNLVNAGITMLYLVGVIVLRQGGDITVTGCAAAYGVSQLLGIAAFLILARRTHHPEGDRIPLREYRGYALRAYLPNVAQYGMLRMDIPVIQLLAGTAAVALYAVALPLAEGLMLLPVAVALVMFSSVTTGAVDRTKSARVAGLVLAGTAVMAIALGLVVPFLVPYVYGPAYRGSVEVIWCMLPGLVIFSAGRTAQTYLSATDRLRHVTLASTAGVAAGAAALLVLTPRFGAAGAGVADSVGYLAYAGSMMWGLLPGRPGLRLLMAARRRAAAVMAIVVRVGGAAWPGLTVIAAAGAVGVISTQGKSSLIVIAGAAVAGIMVAVPGAGLCVLAVVIPVSQTSGGASVVTAKDLLVLVVAGLVGQVAAGRMVRPRAGAVALALMLIGYFTLSALLAAGPGMDGVHNVFDVAALGLTLLCLPLMVTDDTTSRWGLVLFALTAAVTSIMEIPVSEASLAQTGGDTAIAAGQTGALNHNAEGVLFVLALGVLLARFPRTRSLPGRIVLAVGIAAVTAGIAFSFSRSSYFGAMAVIALFAIRRSIRGLIGAAVVLACATPLLPAAVMTRLGTVWSSNGLDISSAARLDLWTSAVRMFTAHPLFGIGYLNFSTALPSYFTDTGTYPIADIVFSQLDFAHNSYLSILAETGIVGGLLVGTLIVTGWRRAWSAARDGDWAGESALLAFAGVGVCSLFGEPIFVPAVLAGFLFVILTAQTRKVSRDGITRGAAISSS